MSKKSNLFIVPAFLLLQACSFTNKPFEKYSDNQDYINTVTNLKVGEEHITPANSKAYESTLIIQKNNIVQCLRDITYTDGIAKYHIPAKTYKALGLIEVEKGKKLPFINGAYQAGAIGGSSGQLLYFPINPDGSLYKSYYTDPYKNLANAKGELKEWGGNGIASDDCTPPVANDLANISVCSVYYNGHTRQNGYTAPTLTLDNGKERKTVVVTTRNNLNFCGVSIDIHETTDVLYFTVRNIATNQQ